jgi:hypothetical protein
MAEQLAARFDAMTVELGREPKRGEAVLEGIKLFKSTPNSVGDCYDKWRKKRASLGNL